MHKHQKWQQEWAERFEARIVEIKQKLWNKLDAKKRTEKKKDQ